MLLLSEGANGINFIRIQIKWSQLVMKIKFPSAWYLSNHLNEWRASDVGDHCIWNFAAQVETKHIQVLQIIIAYHILSAF